MFSALLHSFGLDISDLSAKLIAVKSNFRGERVIQTWAKCDIPEGVIVDGDIRQQEKAVALLTAMLAEPVRRVGTPYVTASLPESKTFMKVIEVDAAGDVGARVREELPNHIPLAIEELVIDWEITRTFDERAMVTVGAVPKAVAERYTELLTACGLKPVAFEIEAQAIARAVAPVATNPSSLRAGMENLYAHISRAGRNEPAPPPVSAPPAHTPARLLVDMGATRTSLVMVDWETIQFTSSVPLSGVDATRRIAERLKLTFDEAERAKKICGLDPKKCKGAVSTVLQGALNNLAVEIERAIEFYQTHFKRGRPVAEVVLTGGGANLAHAETQLAEQLSVPVRIGNPLVNLSQPFAADAFPTKEALSFTTACGLALRDVLPS
ncbi:hypothetical protein A3J36_03010 [Candidatus Uhrbacteria bacterium RIFCSPLOWO2_02_FULL_54_37]|uniref:SHS2 domain-containing protein n=2 Tax=Candidatus Uhriibacteriota TaxID=1752732 RepID=A0A1F7VMC5_9BACT|nr:MAG: hypothetical protein A3B36_02620 [Candidatus Uhrbacteria bacterium RIFCSPLOWO2_01_FULL_55_36]OGL91104.1 MAG: hypothetical protein A3J36_03010 [Candidatus Uhrbacteria bacterium RIFCSPLOWO2_02_FULL_54_37]